MKNTTVFRYGMLLLVALAVGCVLPPGEEGNEGEDMGNPSLFKGADPNTIGNTANVLPSQAFGQAPLGYGDPKTIVKFQPSAVGGWRTDSELLDQETDPQVLTASIFATPNPSNDTNGGPITGIALFASGSGVAQQVEFDIPVATNPGPPVVPFPQAFSGGVQISVPATSLEIRARNDANLIPTTFGIATPNISIGSSSSVLSTIPVSVTASIGKGTKTTFSRVTKTVWMINHAASDFVPTNTSFVLVPPFASSVRVTRWSGASSTSGQIRIDLLSITGIIDSITVAAGALCPEISLGGQTIGIAVTNTDAAINLQKIALIFTLAI